MIHDPDKSNLRQKRVEGTQLEVVSVEFKVTDHSTPMRKKQKAGNESSTHFILFIQFRIPAQSGLAISINVIKTIPLGHIQRLVSQGKSRFWEIDNKTNYHRRYLVLQTLSCTFLLKVRIPFFSSYVSPGLIFI